MALLESVKIPLGSSMPDFELFDPSETKFEGRALVGKKGLLVVFTCNHCPYAQALWGRVIRLAAYAKSVGVETVAINPNINPNYPDDAPVAMKTKIVELGILFPYLVDETQEVARAFQAQCTPDIYLYDADLKLVYHGRVDDNWKDESAVTKEELKAAVENLAEGKPISEEQKPSMGCSIKWKS